MRALIRGLARGALGTSLLLGVAACGGGGGTGGAAPTPTPPPAAAAPAEPLPDKVATFRDRTGPIGLGYALGQQDLNAAKTSQTVSGGLALDDVDNDGRPELYVAHGRNEKGRLFSYDGARFVAMDDNNGIAPSSMDRAGYFVDLNADGWKDFVSVQYLSVEVFMNDGTGRFYEDTASTNIHHSRSTFSMAAADFDVDGDLDLFFAHWAGGWDLRDPLTEYLWRNDGGGFFEDMSDRVAIRDKPFENRRYFVPENSFTPTFADIDSDGYPDMLLASDFSSSQVLRNEAGSSFSDATTAVITDKNGMGSAVGDYDGDGDMDWFVSSIHDIDTDDVGTDTGNRLYRNDGFGDFEDVTDAAGVRNGDWGWGSCFADFDNDGHLDLFHTNGMPSYEERYVADRSRLFMSDGDGTFSERSGSSGITHTGQGRGVVCADYDADGDIDIFIANNGDGPTFYENTTDNSNHYLAIDLVGADANPDAIGARVTVVSASGQQVREVRLGSWYLSQGPQTLHFGMGQDDMATSIDISWPGPARARSQFQRVAADQRLLLRHP